MSQTDGTTTPGGPKPVALERRAGHREGWQGQLRGPSLVSDLGATGWGLGICILAGSQGRLVPLVQEPWVTTTGQESCETSSLAPAPSLLSGRQRRLCVSGAHPAGDAGDRGRRGRRGGGPQEHPSPTVLSEKPRAQLARTSRQHATCFTTKARYDGSERFYLMLKNLP